jgi:hypothetical protein
MPNALYQRPTVDNAVYKAFGMQPGMDRLNLLPRKDPRQGWIAPNLLYQMARAVVAPGVAAHGGDVSPEDALNFAGNVSLGGIGVSSAMKNPAPGHGKTVGMAIEGPLYRGSHIAEEGVRPNTYVTPDQQYASGFGDYSREFMLDTNKTLDLRDIGNEPMTLNKFLDALKAHGMDDDTLADIYHRSGAQGAAWENVLAQRPWQWIRQHTEALAAGAKDAGMDSIRMMESQFSGNKPGKIAESWVVLDPSRLSQISPNK